MEHNYDERYDPLEEEEDYHVYRQPLSHHYQREFREPQFFQASSGTEKNFLTRCLSLFDSKGAFVAFAIAIAVILYTHYQGTLPHFDFFYSGPFLCECSNFSRTLLGLELQITSKHGSLSIFLAMYLLQTLSVSWPCRQCNQSMVGHSIFLVEHFGRKSWSGHAADESYLRNRAANSIGETATKPYQN